MSQTIIFFIFFLKNVHSWHLHWVVSSAVLTHAARKIVYQLYFYELNDLTALKIPRNYAEFLF